MPDEKELLKVLIKRSDDIARIVFMIFIVLIGIFFMVVVK